MNTPPSAQERFLTELLAVVERIALEGDLSAIRPLLEMTTTEHDTPLVSALAEAFGRMVVQLEAKEFRLENTIEDLLRVKQELELANYDPLTGLPNRVIFRDRLQLGLLQAQRAKGMLAVLFLDLDRFKAVNDTLGHEAGDELLKQVTVRLRTCIRDVDTLARVGGDEFVCVLPGIVNTAIAEEIAGRFIRSLTEEFTLVAGKASIGTSIGIAFFPQHGTTGDVLVQSADQAMYSAKHGGRNRYVVTSG